MPTRDRLIEQLAYGLAELTVPTTRAAVERQNTAGWTVDLAPHPADQPGRAGNWTRHEGVVLAPAELARLWQQARALGAPLLDD